MSGSSEAGFGQTETQRHRDTDTETETQRHRDSETKRHRDTETHGGKNRLNRINRKTGLTVFPPPGCVGTQGV